MSENITNKESFSADAQICVAAGDHTPRIPGIPIINPAKVPDNTESDIAPAVGSPFQRALTRIMHHI
jgi:hypothetical protein